MFKSIFKGKEEPKQAFIYVEANGKSLSEKGYVTWLDNVQKELRTKIVNEILPKKQQPGFDTEKIRQVGKDIVQSVLNESKHFEANLNDSDQVRVSKEKVATVIKMIMHECGLSSSELFTKSQQIEDIIELSEDDLVSESMVEISSPTYEQIESQAKGILALVEHYKRECLEGVLAPMWEKYEKEIDERMKGLYLDDFLIARNVYVESMDNDLKEINDSEYFELSAAKADLLKLRNEIAKYKVSNESKQDQEFTSSEAA